MKILFFIFALAVGQAHAAYTSANSTGSWKNPGSSASWSGGSGGSTGGVVGTIETVKVGNTYIPVPTWGNINGTAVAATMVSALRNAPTAMLGGLMLQWLLNQGMEWIDGEWKKKQPPSQQYPSGGTGWTVDYSTPSAETPEGACHSWINGHYHVQGTCTPNGQTESTTMNSVGFHWENGQGNYGELFTRNPQGACPPGSTFNSTIGMCEVPGGYQPAGQSDWDQVAGVTPPDAVMNDICGRLFALDGIGCRVTSLGTKTAAAPISDYYTDGTGTSMRQSARFTPSPTATDPLRGEITVFNETKVQPGTTTEGSKTTTTSVDTETGKVTTTETDSSTGVTTTTKTDPVTGVKTTTTTNTNTNTTETKTEAPDKDFCVEHPKASACEELGEADDSELEKQNVGTSVTPVTVGGSGSCPADKHVSYLGAPLTISFQPICTAAGWINPIVLALAWLAAGYILLGAVRGGD